jgi:hypothetical protein
MATKPKAKGPAGAQLSEKDLERVSGAGVRRRD